jgi:hypothetical protein
MLTIKVPGEGLAMQLEHRTTNQDSDNRHRLEIPDRASTAVELASIRKKAIISAK